MCAGLMAAALTGLTCLDQEPAVLIDGEPLVRDWPIPSVPVEAPAGAGPTPTPIVGSERLGATFEALDQLSSSSRPFHVLHLGDSHVAAELITGRIRELLQSRFGDAGRGFVRADQAARYGGRLATSNGWRKDRLSSDPPLPYGLGPTALVSEGPGARLVLDLDPADRRVDVLLADSDSAWISIVGGSLSATQTEGPLRRLTFSLAAGARALEVQARAPSIRYVGAVFRSEAPGIIYSSLGEVGEGWVSASRLPLEGFTAALRLIEPDLVVIMLGGNDAIALRKAEVTADALRFAVPRLLHRIRRATPSVPCLVIGPLDAGERRANGTIGTAAGIAEVRGIVLREAAEQGCATWDVLAAMGGEGSFGRWLSLGWMNPDLVHPYRKGADLLGWSFVTALRDAYLGLH